MEEIILKYGFKEGINENEYIRNNWTLRFDSDQIEIFNDPDIGEGFYYIESLATINLEEILEDIDDIERLFL